MNQLTANALLTVWNQFSPANVVNTNTFSLIPTIPEIDATFG